MHKGREVDRLVEQTRTGDADAEATLRREVQPALACLLRWSLQAGAGPTALDQVLSDFLRDQSATAELATLGAAEVIERLAQVLTDRLIAGLATMGAAGETVSRQRTVALK